MSAALPPGWRMTNNTGSHAGPARRSDDDSDSGDDTGAGDVILDIAPDSPGWEDMEDDSEQMNIKDFFSNKTFPSAQAMLEYCRSTHDIDFLAICRQHSLDFYSTIKAVNYIRSQAQKGNLNPDTSNPELWSDEKYLQPVLDDDPLLFCLDDVVGFGNDDQEPVDFDDRMAREAAKQQHTDLDSVEE